MNSVLGTLGQALVLAAMACASAGAVVGFASGRSGSVAGWDWTRRLALGFSACIVAATVVMEVALLNHDFTVRYVAQVGSTQVPTYITIVSLWSALEGSILFWGAVLGVYVAVAVWLNGGRNADSMAYTTGTWMITGAFFCFLMAGPANPFYPGPTTPMTEGPGPNPLLQNHLLMIVHPPMLYLGYVGMTIPFGIAVGALLRGKLGPGQLSLLRNWLMVAWCFQTIGIVLGGWWAYEVLGWGGYWAWDPVENASFLPWLTATAALHAAMLPSRRGTMQGWTTTLVLATFLLTILGTFMTRSGVFNSVHAFSQSDIGPTILVFLGGMLVFSVVLLAMRLDSMEGEGRVKGTLSRESMFLVNNSVLVSLTFTVLVGTVYPLLAEAIKGVKVSVGEPFYNQVAVPTGLLLLFLMGVGPALPWGATTLADAARRLAPAAGLAAVCTGIGFALGVKDPYPLGTCATAGFALWVTGKELLEPFFGGGDVLDRFRRQRRRWAGYVVHLGIIMIVVAIAMSHAYQQDREVRLTRGSSVEFAGYTLTYAKDALLDEPHRSREVAYIDVARDGRAITTLEPAMNQYDGRSQPIGSPDVHSNGAHDLYASLMMLDRGAGTVALHLFLNPLVYWIWIGTGVCAFGAVLAILPMGRAATRAAAAPEPALQAGK